MAVTMSLFSRRRTRVLAASSRDFDVVHEKLELFGCVLIPVSGRPD
jgi:hypothetical protein